MTILTALVDIEHEPLDEEPLFFIETRDRDKMDELGRVVLFRQLVRKAAPNIMLVAIPNARRGQWAKNQARREGAVWGAPDMLALAPGKIAFLEWKAGDGKPAAHQIAVLNRLHRMGFPVGVFRQPETALRWLRDQGFPFVGANHAA